MKSFIVSVLFAFCATSVYPQIKNEHAKLGFVSHLVYLKINSELKIPSLMEEEAYKKDANIRESKDQAYNLLRIFTDQLIFQLMVDMKSKNSQRAFKLIDQSFKRAGNETGLKNNRTAYYNIISEIQKEFDTFIISDTKPGLSAELWTAIAEQITTVITSARDHREKKVAAISEILDKLRFRDISELAKKKDKDDDKK
jgi:hypothetical protein